MDVVHKTPFVGSLDAILDKDGSEARLVSLKATYEFKDNGSLTIAEDQEPIHLMDKCVGEVGQSSMLYESDGAYFKPATDIVAIGKAYAPQGKKVPSFTLSLSVGTLSKAIMVFGDRRWRYSSVFGIRMSPPQPVVEVPLCWEKAFGGADTFHKNQKKHTWEARNPVGTGFRVTRSAEALDDLPLPNFEDPGQLIKSWHDRPTPAGLGFIGRTWHPRVQYAGTYDEAWQKYRMPILPLDFDYRFFNAAVPDLIYPGYLNGGERVKAVNLSRRGLEEFTLPLLTVLFRAIAKRRHFALQGKLDTAVFDFERRRVILTWRAKYPVLMNESANIVTAEVNMRQ